MIIFWALGRLETQIHVNVEKSALVTVGDAGGRGDFTFTSTKNCSAFVIY